MLIEQQIEKVLCDNDVDALLMTPEFNKLQADLARLVKQREPSQDDLRERLMTIYDTTNIQMAVLEQIIDVVISWSRGESKKVWCEHIFWHIDKWDIKTPYNGATFLYHVETWLNFCPVCGKERPHDL